MRFQPETLASLLLLPALMGIAGCGDAGGHYPSLAIRPAERDAGQPVAPATTSPAEVAPSPSDADLISRLDALVAKGRVGYQDFTDKRAAAERLAGAAASAPLGSEEWSVATQALSGLEAARARTAAPMAEVDRFDVHDRVAHAVEDANPGQQERPARVAITSARDSLSGWLAEEDAVIGDLHNKLAR